MHETGEEVQSLAAMPPQKRPKSLWLPALSLKGRSILGKSQVQDINIWAGSCGSRPAPKPFRR